jgi:hypothetical protein
MVAWQPYLRTNNQEMRNNSRAHVVPIKSRKVHRNKLISWFSWTKNRYHEISHSNTKQRFNFSYSFISHAFAARFSGNSDRKLWTLSDSRGAGIVHWYSAGLRAGWSGVRFPAGARNFSPHHRVQTGSVSYPASYQMGTRVSFPGGKAAGPWSWPLTSI